MTVWENVLEARLRQEVKISQQLFGFMPRKSKTDEISAGKKARQRSKGGAVCL